MKRLKIIALIIACLWAFLLSAHSINAQSRTSQDANTDKVTGTVFSEEGEPLVGVFISIKDTKTAAQTDLDGKYSIKSPEAGKSYTLVFQYLGMKTKHVVVKEARRLDVVLMSDNQLDATVIVGAYGTKQRREDLVGSAFQVNSEKLKDKPKARIDDLLTGLVPGMSIQANTDAASNTRTRYETRIRGSASLSASSEPIWIIDGVPTYTGNNTNIVPGMSWTVSPLSFIDPNDIESITVLKDADQTTIYGANGSNGVILVTTKSGRKNQPLNINLTVNMGVSAPDYSTMFKMMNASQYMEVAREAWANAGYKMSEFPYQDNYYNSYTTTETYWPEQYLGLGTDLYAGLRLSSGTTRVSNSVSASYYRNANIVQGDNSQRFSFDSKQSFELWKRAELGLNLSASYNLNDLFPLGRSFMETLPIFSPYLEDGHTDRLFNNIYSSEKQDFYMRKFFDNEIPTREYSDNMQKSMNTKGSVNFNWEIIDGLHVRSTFGINYTHSKEDLYDSMNTLDGLDSNNNRVGSAQRANASFLNWTNTNILRYDKKFAGKHSLGVYAGVELSETARSTSRVSGSGFSNDFIKELEYASTISEYSTSNVNTSRSLSFFGRLSYSYDSRYYISGNFRMDGNSNFGIYSRWAPFASVGLSWNIHKEPFFDSALIKMLKVKYSFGKDGNSKIDASTATGTYNMSDSYSYMGNAGALIGSVPNPGLSWESTYKHNAGVRLELKDIIDIELEGYYNTTVDLLSKVYVSRTITDNSVYANIGEMMNRGIELSLTTYNFNRSTFDWTTTFNIAHNENRILELYNGNHRSFGTTIWTEGHDKNTYYLVRWAGVDPSDGMPMWYDLNGNITKTYSESNRVPDKTSTPIVHGGILNEMRFGNWSVSFQINYNIGGWKLASYASSYMNDGYDITEGNQAIELYYYRWKTPGQASTFPKVSQTTTGSGRYSTRFLYNATYFDLATASITYALPSKLLHKARIKGITLSLQGNNLYYLTPDQKKGFNSFKTMSFGYPRTRTFTLGLNMNF